jgi:hypothetical protein
MPQAPTIKVQHPVYQDKFMEFAAGTSPEAVAIATERVLDEFSKRPEWGSLDSAAQKSRRDTPPQAFVPSVLEEASRDFVQGAPPAVRALVGAQFEENRLAALQQFDPTAVRLGENNFAYTDPDTGLPTLYNPEGFDVGDIASLPIETAEAVGAGVGGLTGALSGAALTAVTTGPAAPVAAPVGAIAGAAVGTGAGAMLFRNAAEQIAMQLADVEDPRTWQEQLGDAGTTAALNTLLPAYGAGITRVGSDVARFPLRGGRPDKGMKSLLEDAKSWLPETRIDPLTGEPIRTLSLAQVTDKTVPVLWQRLITTLPGGARTMKRRINSQLKEIATSLDEKLAAFTRLGDPDPVRAARAVISGHKKFWQNFRLRSDGLYKNLDDVLPDDTAVVINNFDNVLVAATNPTPGMPSLGKVLTPSQVTKLKTAVNSDLPTVQAFLVNASGEITEGTITKTIPYEDLRMMRTEIGRKLGDTRIGTVEDLPRRVLKDLYAALSKDLRKAAQQQDMAWAIRRTTEGGPRKMRKTAVQLFDIADRFYRVGMDRMDTFISPLLKESDVPELLFAKVQGFTKEGVTRLREVRRGVDNDLEWRMLVGSVIEKLGAPKGGSVGEFSFNTFLENWNGLGGGNKALNRQVKDILFSGPGMRGMREDLDALARIGRATQINAEPFAQLVKGQPPMAGTGIIMGSVASAMGGVAGSAAFGTVSGTGFGMILGLVGALGTSKGSAHLLTNRKFVQWLARGATLRPQGVGAHIGKLSAIALDSDVNTRDAIQSFLANLSVISAEDGITLPSGPQATTADGAPPERPPSTVGRLRQAEQLSNVLGAGSQ